VTPHTLRHACITAALDAGGPLRDVQEAASHADPRTTIPYDRARGSLDRHPTYIVAAYIAGAATQSAQADNRSAWRPHGQAHHPRPRDDNGGEAGTDRNHNTNANRCSYFCQGISLIIWKLTSLGFAEGRTRQGWAAPGRSAGSY